ncbi:carboxypeptidase-like regulatory domain-containing protein, partial [Ignavibacterium sp.]|uniref:carboxypeptidase-like regulatory domain-containing protein n=1 Tax=Ignavibacterium sp. TaxID=2651167 RepID=UPI00307E38D1
MKRIKFLLSAILLSINIQAQNGFGDITGTVVDAITRQPLIGANIILIGTNFGAATDINGRYIIKNISAEMYQLRASIIGYTSRIKTDVMVQPGKLTQIDFELTPQTIEIENIVVTADYFGKNILEPTSVRNFSYEELRRSPGGFEDVIRALSVLPGVAQADAGRND